MQLIVLGMHRSGTSALARLVSLLGAYIGEAGDFNPATPDNPRGFWEYREVWAADEALLTALGGAWDEVDDLDPGRLTDLDRQRFAAQARAAIAHLDARRGAGPWVIKDPRLCLTLPYWRPFLDRPVVLFIHRSPLAVARSLATRDGFALPLSVALWERYNLAALEASADLPRLLVSHHDLIADPAGTARRLLGELQALGAAGLAEPPEGVIERSIDPALDHHREEPEGERQLLPPVPAALAQAFAEGRAPATVPALSLGARELLASHRLASRRRRELELGWTEATTAFNAERKARLAAEKVAAELTAQAVGLQTKVADATVAFAAESEARLRAEAALKAALHRHPAEEQLEQATRAYEAERDARLHAEHTIAELHEQALALQAKIAADTQIFAAEHAARLKAEREVAELLRRYESLRV